MNHASIKPKTMAEQTKATYQHMEPYFDSEYNLVWCYMHAYPRPCFTPELLNEIIHLGKRLSGQIDSLPDGEFRYFALASDIPGVFNLGGDLHLFKHMIEDANHEGLLGYAKKCIDAIYANLSNYGRGITTIGLVQGDALGGGFESAISCDVLIAERSAKLGLPEVLFNLFPGMGAYSILSRKIGSAQAERMILSGKIYSAEELYDMGVVDVLAEDHQGEMAVYHYIKKENASRNGYRAVREAKGLCNPVTYEELLDITNIWVDAAMRLSPRDLRMMERLVSRQINKSAEVL